MGYRYISAQQLDREVMLGLDALASRFPEHVDPGPVVFAGFSMGANMGATLIMQHPDRFPRAILVEGGNTDWNDRSALAFSKGGGSRILFGCGTEGCFRWATFCKRRLDRNGITTRIAWGQGGGHSYHDGPVHAALTQAFDWAVEGDARWQALAIERSPATVVPCVGCSAP
jgi:pimeloyl-ACP methyl ester carboxylesterase